MKKKIVCVTATYGRFSKLSDTVSCFLSQNYENKELLILNNHPMPLFCDLSPQIKIYNEPIYPTLGDCRNRLIDLAEGDFIQTFDDDDLHFPWKLSQAMRYIKSHPAWKPKKSWFWCGGKEPELVENVFESAMTVRIDIAKKYKYQNSMGDEHQTLLKGIDKEGGCHTDDMGILASYCYTWGFGGWHASGSLGSGNIEDRTRTWKEHNQDVGDGVIKYVDLEKYWKHFKSSFDLYRNKN